jgi:hypothetical protein
MRRGESSSARAPRSHHSQSDNSREPSRRGKNGRLLDRSADTGPNAYQHKRRRRQLPRLRPARSARMPKAGQIRPGASPLGRRTWTCATRELHRRCCWQESPLTLTLSSERLERHSSRELHTDPFHNTPLQALRKYRMTGRFRHCLRLSDTSLAKYRSTDLLTGPVDLTDAVDREPCRVD